jgi:hypothetical protein
MEQEEVDVAAGGQTAQDLEVARGQTCQPEQ